MGIIDRYLLRRFLETFFICFFSLMGLYVIIECSTNMDEFIRCGEKTGGALKVIGQYFSYRIFAFFDVINGMLVLISAMYTIAWIQRNNEMTALMAAGISRIRVIMPLIFLSIFVFLLAAANRELVIPRFREQLSHGPKDLIGDQAQELLPHFDNLTDVIISGKSSYAENKRIDSPDFFMPPPLMQYGKHVKAENAYYQPAQGNRPGGYLLEVVSEPKHLDTRPSLLWKGRPVLITPHDAPDWLKPDQCFIASNLDFEQLSSGWEFSSTGQLIGRLRNPSLGYQSNVRVAIHSRISQPFIDMTLLFLGLPLVVRREGRNVFFAIGICIGITTVFFLVVRSFQQLGVISMISPPLAAWAPLIIFIPPTVAIAHSMWEE